MEGTYPAKVMDAIMSEYPVLPPGVVNALFCHDAILVRFSDARWRDMVASSGVFHDNQGMSYLSREWSRRSFSDLLAMRNKVHLFLEGIPAQAWSLTTIKRILPMLRIHAIEVETFHKTGVSYFVLYAWVLSPDLLPRFVQLGTDEPRRNSVAEPLDRLQLPQGFTQIIDGGPPLPECPRVHDGLVLVHLDYMEEFVVGTGGAGPSADRDDHNISVCDALPFPWARGVIVGSRSMPEPLPEGLPSSPRWVGVLGRRDTTASSCSTKMEWCCST